MSGITYDADTMTVTVDDSEVQKGLGDLAAKAPAVMKVAINKTARQARRDEISEAEKRYAYTPRGKKKLQGLKQKKRATNSDLENVHKQNDEGKKLDISYYQHTPTTPRMGADAVLNNPRYFRARVLRSEGYKNLIAETNRSKGFLVDITNPEAGTDHIAMLRRKLDKTTDNFKTNTGADRWIPKGKTKPEALDTMMRPGASSAQRKVWDMTVEEKAEENLQENVTQRMEQVIAKAGK